MASRKEPEMDSNREQAKLTGCPLSSYLTAPKDYTLIWSRNSGYWFVSWCCRGGELSDRSLPFSQIAQHLSKSPFLLHQHLPHEFGFCGNRQPSLCFFCLVTMVMVSEGGALGS